MATPKRSPAPNAAQGIPGMPQTVKGANTSVQAGKHLRGTASQPKSITPPKPARKPKPL